MAAFVEECLGRVFEELLRTVKSTADLLEGFNAPLGTFAARTKMCHSLGLLNDAQFKDLDLIRKNSQRICAQLGRMHVRRPKGSFLD
jgi:hypothetical protein